MTLMDSFRVSAKMCISSLDGRSPFSPFLSKKCLGQKCYVQNLALEDLKHFLEVINNSSNLNKGIHDRDSVSISHLSQDRFLRFYFSVFSLVLVSIDKIY